MEIATNPAEFEDPHKWRKGASEQGFTVPEALIWLLYDLMEDSGRTMSDAFSWLLDRAMLSSHGAEYLVADGADRLVVGAMREEKARRLPEPSWEKVDGEMIVDFPAAEEFRPYFGFIWAGPPDHAEIGAAQGRVRMPGDLPLSLQLMNPGRYGRPFRGLPSDLFDEIFATAFEPANDDDLEAISDLHGARVVNLGYLYPAGLLIGHGMRHEVSDEGLSHLDEFDRLEVFGRVRHLRDLTGLTNLWLDGTGVTDGSGQDLQRMTSLNRLSLSQTDITDRTPASVGELTNLEALDLYDTRVTSAGLGSLTGLDRLKKLTLSHTEVDDRGLDYLTRLSSLEDRSLTATGVTLGGLRRLTALPNLNRLEVMYLTEDPDEQAKLREQLPGVAVWFDM